MSQPLYFLAGTTADELGVNPMQPAARLNLALLGKHGLAGVFGDVKPTECIANGINGGPDKKHGVILGYQTVDGKLPVITKYLPDQQEWRKVSEHLWIVTDPQSPTTEADLRRKKMQPGYSLDIGSGERWTIPVIRRIDDSTELPRDIYEENGVLVEPVKAAYRKYWEDSAEVAAWFFQGKWETFTKLRGFKLCVDAMSINYRVGMLEQNVLRLFDAEAIHTILMATVDVPAAQEMQDAQKKTESTSDDLNTTSGPPEG